MSGAGELTSEAQAVFVLAETRQLIEEMEERKEDVEPLRLVRLYCNLSLHIRLAQQALARDALKFFGEQMVKAYNHGGEDLNILVFEAIPGTLSPAQLRKQLIQLYRHCDVDPAPWWDERFWDSFATVLPKVLRDKPIEFDQEMVEAQLKLFHERRPSGRGAAATAFRGLLDGAGAMGLVPVVVILKYDAEQAKKYECSDPFVWNVCMVSTRAAGPLEVILPYHRDGAMRGRSVGGGS